MLSQDAQDVTGVSMSSSLSKKKMSKEGEQSMTPEQKKWIDEASYEDLLRKLRFAPAGDPMFIDDTVYEYYSKVVQERKAADPAAHVRASKSIGW